MKTYRSFAPALVGSLVVALCASLSAADTGAKSLVHPVDVVNVPGKTPFTLGATAATVVKTLGQPRHTRVGDPAGKLDDDVWIYTHVVAHAPGKAVSNDGCNTLLITLRDTGAGRGWRVVDMKLANPRARRYFVNQISDLAATKTLIASEVTAQRHYTDFKEP
jgi:hypothetical protein